TTRAYFNGTQTLGGSGNVNFANNATLSGLIANQNNMTLTIGPNITVHGGSSAGITDFFSGAVIGISDRLGGGSNASIINQGKFSADVSGQILQVRTSGSFTNPGTLEGKNGGNLNVTTLQGNLGSG